MNFKVGLFNVISDQCVFQIIFNIEERDPFRDMEMLDLEHFAEPTTSPKESVDLNATTRQGSSNLNLNSSCKHTREDFFDKAFRAVDNPQKGQKKVRKQRPRPPTVATSEEYRRWFEELEKEKQVEEQLKAEKKAAREKKKQLSKVKQTIAEQKTKLKLNARDKRRKLPKWNGLLFIMIDFLTLYEI